MLELVLVRHGKTQLNDDGVLGGHLPVSLSVEGTNKAKELAACLKNIRFDKIVSSDLVRAMECTERIIKYFPRLEVIQEPLLRERNFGQHHGRKITSLGYKDVSYKEMVRHFYECNCPGGN